MEGLLGEIVLAGSKTEMRRDVSVEGCDDEWDSIYKRTCSTKKVYDEDALMVWYQKTLISDREYTSYTHKDLNKH